MERSLDSQRTECGEHQQELQTTQEQVISLTEQLNIAQQVREMPLGRDIRVLPSNTVFPHRKERFGGSNAQFAVMLPNARDIS